MVYKNISTGDGFAQELENLTARFTCNSNPTGAQWVCYISPEDIAMSCSPKFEPAYKVQSLTERGRIYDWHEEAA